MVYHVSLDLTRKFIEESEHFDGPNGGLVENLCIFLGEFLYVWKKNIDVTRASVIIKEFDLKKNPTEGNWFQCKIA